MLRMNSPELDRLLDEVAGIAGETREEAVRRALEERRVRLTANGTPPESPPAQGRLSPEEVSTRLAALDQLQRALALTPEKADAWIAEVRAERMAHRIPGDVESDDVQP